VTNMPPEVQVELSEEEFELDSSSDGVAPARVETTDNSDVDNQDPEAQEAGDVTNGG
jgi:hypothetical protein